MYRTHKEESELQAIATANAQTVIIRTYDERGNSTDTQRATTKTERKILTAVLFGALLAANNHPNIEEDSKIIATAEFTALQLINNINTYNSVYIPLNRIFRAWELRK